MDNLVVQDLHDLELSKDIVFEYLDDLRESGIVNMFGAGSHLVNEYGMLRISAQTLLKEWMNDHNRHMPLGG